MTTDTYAEQRATDRLRLAEMERRYYRRALLAVIDCGEGRTARSRSPRWPATGTRTTGIGRDRDTR